MFKSLVKFCLSEPYRNKVRELDEYIARLKQQITDADSKTQQVEKESVAYREQQNTKPEVRLQSEINLLTLEKVGAIPSSELH